MEPTKPFIVRIIESSTGMVCTLAGVRWNSGLHRDDEGFQSFASREEAVQFVERYLESKQGFECCLHRGDEFLELFMPPPSNT